MKKTLSRLLVTVMILALCMSGASVAFAANSVASASNPGISVQYNGENIVFTDAVPQITNARTMVPFRQILETMGAVVTYNEPTKTVTAVKKDMQFSFDVGGTDITIIKDGKTTVKKMDVAPFIDAKSRRTYVPVRFMGESMNYNVAWDQSEKTAIIIDPAVLFANADVDFSIISKLLANDVDPEKTYETTGSFLVDMSTYVVPGLDSMDFTVSGDMTGIQQKSNADMVMKMMINIDKLLSSMSAEEKALMKPILDSLKNIDMKLKMNGESGEIFMNSPLFALTDPTIAPNTWFQMNIFETYDELGIDLRPFMDYNNQSQHSLSHLLQIAILAMNTGDVNSYNNMKTVYSFIKNLIGDEAFSTISSGTITTHSLRLDKNSLINATNKTLSEEGLRINPTDGAELKKAIDETSLEANIVIKEKNGGLYSYNMNCDLFYDELEVKLAMSGDAISSKLEMDFDYPSMAKMVIKADSQYAETTKALDLSLPKDAKVLDYNTHFMPNI